MPEGIGRHNQVDNGGDILYCLEVCRPMPDRKSTRLNSSHVRISYAVFCLKKKKSKKTLPTLRMVYYAPQLAQALMTQWYEQLRRALHQFADISDAHTPLRYYIDGIVVFYA